MKITTTMYRLHEALQETIEEEYPHLDSAEQDTLACRTILAIMAEGRLRRNASRRRGHSLIVEHAS